MAEPLFSRLDRTSDALRGIKTVTDPVRLERAHQLHDQGLQAFQQGEVQQALRFYDEAIQMGGDRGAIWSIHDRARIFVDIGDSENLSKAIASLQKATRILPNNAQVHASLALAFGRMGLYKYCLDEYLRAYTLDPNNYEAKIIEPLDLPPEERAHRLHDQGLDLLKQSKPRESLRFYEAAVALIGEKAGAWSLHDKGMALAQMGRYPEAIATLSRVKKLIKDSPIPLEDLTAVQKAWSRKQAQVLTRK